MVKLCGGSGAREMMNRIAIRPMVAGLLTAVGLWAQAPAEFEAASIKPAAPMAPGRMTIGFGEVPGRPLRDK